VLTLTEHFDGASWTVIPSPSPITGSDLDQNVLTGVKAFAPNNVTAVGFTLDFAKQRELTVVEHWDGTSWKVVPSPNQSEAAGSLNTLTHISGFGPHDLYAVGFYADAQTAGQPTTLVEHFDGSGWSIIFCPTDGVAQHLNGVFALTRTRNIWTVGGFSTNGADSETGLLQVPQTLVSSRQAGRHFPGDGDERSQQCFSDQAPGQQPGDFPLSLRRSQGLVLGLRGDSFSGRVPVGLFREDRSTRCGTARSKNRIAASAGPRDIHQTTGP
jgi:hypothetical protein